MSIRYAARPTSLEDTIERLILFRDRADRHAGYTACLGYAPWKHGSARTLLYSPRGETGFHSRAPAAIRAAKARGGRVVFWAARETPALAAELTAAAVPVLRMEDGFVRSRGLGSDFHRAASVVLDDLGVYYDATGPSRLETILETTEFDEITLARAAPGFAAAWSPPACRNTISGPPAGRRLTGRPSDPNCWSSARSRTTSRSSRAAGSVRTNLGLLQAAAGHRGAFLIFKPHPDVESGNRPGAVDPRALADLADAVVRDLDIDACIAGVDGLATMTSLAGFETLLRGKPVWTYGRPFFAGWGLTHDALDFPRRTRRLTLEQLIAGTLITYPIYIHPPTGLPCGPEELVSFLERDRQTAPDNGPKRLRYWRAVFESLRRRPRARF